MDKLSREEKEELYIKKMTELQIKWGNPIDDDWDFISEWTEEQLNEGLDSTISQLKFEKGLSFIKKLFFYAICLFVFLGIIGILAFGIRQLF